MWEFILAGLAGFLLGEAVKAIADAGLSWVFNQFGEVIDVSELPPRVLLALKE